MCDMFRYQGNQPQGIRSTRLGLLAEQHPLATEALIAISGSVRNTATLLEVVVATKMGALSGLRSGKCLICDIASFEQGFGIAARPSRGERHSRARRDGTAVHGRK